MQISNLIERIALGVFVGCFIVSLVEVLIALQSGPQNVSFSGYDVINAFLGSIVIGWGFSLSGFIYENDWPLPAQVLFQMGIGFAVLFSVAIYLTWLPITLGVGVIIEWVTIAVIFAVMFWLGFYIYYYLQARDINKKLD